MCKKKITSANGKKKLKKITSPEISPTIFQKILQVFQVAPSKKNNLEEKINPSDFK